MSLIAQTNSTDPVYFQKATQVSVRFLHYETLVSLVPMVLVLVPAGFLLKSLWVNAPNILAIAWIWFVMGLLVGRFAIASARGRFHADFFEAFPYYELPSYTIRYLTASVVWGIPLYLLADRFDLAKVTWKLDFNFWLALLTISALSILPLLSAIVATMGRSPLHIFMPSLWKHMLRMDNNVWGVVVAQLGALSTAGLLYLPLLGLLSLIAGLVSPTLSQYLAYFPILLPLLSWPIIAGRLAGVWVHYHPVPPEADLILPDPDAAIELTEIHVPDASMDSTEMEEKSESPLSLEVEGVVAALATGEATLAVQAFKNLGKQRHSTQWPLDVLEALSKSFAEVRDFRETGWCVHTLEAQRGQIDRAEKRLIQTANAAIAARDLQSAQALFRYYLIKHPQGQFAAYAQKQLEER